MHVVRYEYGENEVKEEGDEQDLETSSGRTMRSV